MVQSIFIERGYSTQLHDCNRATFVISKFYIYQSILKLNFNLMTRVSKSSLYFIQVSDGIPVFKITSSSDAINWFVSRSQFSVIPGKSSLNCKISKESNSLCQGSGGELKVASGYGSHAKSLLYTARRRYT